MTDPKSDTREEMTTAEIWLEMPICECCAHGDGQCSNYVPCENCQHLIDFVKSLAAQARKEGARKAISRVYQRANEFANADPTMIGAENIKAHHYFNALEVESLNNEKGTV